MGINFEFGDENICVISVKGKLDVRNLNKIDEMYETCLQNKVRKVVFNLKEMTFADSKGLSEMIRMIKCAHQHFGMVDLIDNCMRVSEIFVLSGLGDMIKIQSSLDETLGF